MSLCWRLFSLTVLYKQRCNSQSLEQKNFVVLLRTHNTPKVAAMF